MSNQYSHSMITATEQLIDELMRFNFSKHPAFAKWLRVKPVVQQMFKQLDNSGDENLRNLALKYRGLVEAAKQDNILKDGE